MPVAAIAILAFVMGLPGVGKTLSAPYYARWDVVLAEERRIYDDLRHPNPFRAAPCVMPLPSWGPHRALLGNSTDLCLLVDSLVRWGFAFRSGNEAILRGRRGAITPNSSSSTKPTDSKPRAWSKCAISMTVTP